jgi:hypothetical protein
MVSFGDEQARWRTGHFLSSERTGWLLIVDVKAKFDKLEASFLAQLKKGAEDEI